MHLSCDGMVAGGSGMGGGGVTMAGPSLPRRNFQCNECFKRFKGRVELYMHAEACLMEAFENEALAVLADLPPPHKFERHGFGGGEAGPSAMPATAGIVVKPRDVLPQRQERIEIRVGSGGVTATAGGVAGPIKRFKEELADEEGGEGEQLPLADDPPPTLHQQHNAIMDLMCVYDAGPSSGERGMDTIEGPNGLRVMVTVEKADNLHHLEHDHDPHLLGAVLEGDDEEDDHRAHEGMALLEAEERMEERLPMGMMMEGEEEEEEVDGEEEEEQLMEEEMLEMGEEGDMLGGSAVHRPRPRVIGALANADDDSFKPKIECPTCGLVLYRHNFSTHYRIHTGELPFNCNYCERKFRTTSSLKVHLRAHTGEKPYACPNCDYATITKRNLDRHILNNHVRENRTTVRQRRSKYRNEDLPWPAESLYEEEGEEGGVGAGGDHQYQQETEEEEEEEEAV